MSKKSIYLVFIIIFSFIIGVVAGKNWERFSFVSKNNKQAKYSYSFSGEGRFTTEPFYVDDGYILVSVANQTGRNDNLFLEIYYDSNKNKKKDSDDQWWGQYINVAYEEAEVYDGVFPVKVSSGDYFIYIDGGRWDIKVNQYEKRDKKAKQFESFYGDSQSVSDMFYLSKGTHNFKSFFKGETNFIVQIVDDNGNRSSRLVNELGEWEGEFSADIVIPGNYFFYVYGIGEWGIDKI